MDCTKIRKSTDGYVFFLNGSCISWCSRKQGLIALSSTKAEFIAGTDAAKAMQCIVNFLESFNIPERNPHLIGDNQGALALARNSNFRLRTKHIHTGERYIVHLVETGNLHVSNVLIREMIADTITKPLSKEPFMKHNEPMVLS